MAGSKRRQKPVVTHSGSDSESDERHKVVKSSKKPRFKFGQTVWVLGEDGSAQEGPYKIERVVPPSSSSSRYTYTLCEVESSLTVSEGSIYAESKLVKAS